MAFSRLKKRSDRKSTRLNSSHTIISYAVLCLKKSIRSQAGERPYPARLYACAPPPLPGGHSPRARPHVAEPASVPLQSSMTPPFFFFILGAPPELSLFPPPGPSGL